MVVPAGQLFKFGMIESESMTLEQNGACRNRVMSTASQRLRESFTICAVNGRPSCRHAILTSIRSQYLDAAVKPSEDRETKSVAAEAAGLDIAVFC